MENKNWEIINWEKSRSIAFFNANNNAINLITSIPEEDKLMVAGEIKKDIIYWRDWFMSEWLEENPMPTEKEVVEEVKNY